MGTLRFSNGTPGNIQLIHDTQCVTGDAIQIPNGSYTWPSGTSVNNRVNITKSIAILAQSLGGVTITSPDGLNTQFTINKTAAGPIEISGIRFVWPFGYINAPGSPFYSVLVNGGSNLGPYLIHDCHFSANSAYSIRVQGNGGVIWNCVFDSNGSNSGGYGINYQGFDYADWRTVDTLGMDDTGVGGWQSRAGSRNSYLEDCTANDMYIGCINVDDCSRTSVRHCTFNNSATNSHGQETSWQGIRQMEVYDCTYILNTSGQSSVGVPYPLNLQGWVDYRGGCGNITRCVLPNLNIPGINKNNITCSVYGTRRQLQQYPCPPANPSYPAPRQPGIGWNGTGPYAWGPGNQWNADTNNFPNGPCITCGGYPPNGTGYYISGIYAWSNTGVDGIAAVNNADDGCGQNQQASSYIKQGRDVFQSARPGWTSFTYPHPFRQLVFNAAPQPPVPPVLQYNYTGPTPSFVQGNSFAIGTVPTSPPTNLPATYLKAQTAGNTNIALCWFSNSLALVGPPTDTSGNIYSLLYQATSPPAFGLNMAFYISQNIRAAVAGANTVTASINAATFGEINVLEYNSVAASPFDTGTFAGSGNTNNATSAGSPILTTNPFDIVLSGFTVNFPPGTVNKPAGWNLAASAATVNPPGSTYVADQQEFSTGTFNPVWTFPANYWASISASLKSTITTPPASPVVNLAWTESDGSVTGYTLHRGTVNGGPYPVTTALGNALSTTVIGLAPGTYYFVLTSTNSVGTSVNSNQLTTVVSTAAIDVDATIIIR